MNITLRAKDAVANAALIRKCQRRLKALIVRGAISNFEE